MNARHKNELQLIAERASEWLETLAAGASAEQRAAFADWLAESPVHVREFLNMAAIDRMLDRVDTERQMNVAGTDKDLNVMPLRALPPLARSTATGTGWGRWAAGIAIVCVALAALWWAWPDGSNEYVTAIGEQNTVKLPDGSLVNLNTQSRLRVRFSAQTREIDLLEGEALFTVERDPARPFRVHSGKAVIQALGTQFNVYRRNHGITVSVIEGRVSLTPSHSSTQEAIKELGAGEQASVSPGSKTIELANPDLAQVTAWRQRRLVFRSDTLEDIAAEFNRYNKEPRIRIEGEAIAQRRFTGVMDADKPGSLMQFVNREGDLVFERQGAGLVIRMRQPGG